MNNYSAIVVGGGHSGCEAALALSRLGFKTLILAISLDSIAYMACNPSIGGTAKGQLVREIDALGGEMGVIADKSLMQLKMLNFGKGAAVHSLRGQADKNLYHLFMKQSLEKQDNLDILQSEVSEILTKNGKVIGVKTTLNQSIFAPVVIVASGVYLSSEVIIGSNKRQLGPSGFSRSESLTKSLMDLGLEIKRFKTGTPARVKKNSIDFSKMQIQYGDENIYSFSCLTDSLDYIDTPCYLTYTSEQTKQIILENLDKSAMYGGWINGIGPRYCPSIEDKIVRFKDKDRHQVFIEPEGYGTDEMYVQGMSTSFPIDIQKRIYESVVGLENVIIMRYAYAIEYDCIESTQLDLSLRYKNIEGLYFAGQINGSSGYEEAAAQGLIAGINAARFLSGKQPFVMSRADSYIAVLIDDLVTKGTNEPYRMMTSRAEYRLKLRQDNCDIRLCEFGIELGLLNAKAKQKYLQKKQNSELLFELLDKYYPPSSVNTLLMEFGETQVASGVKLSEILKRPPIKIEQLLTYFDLPRFDYECEKYVETQIKYSGYLKLQDEEIAKMQKMRAKLIPKDLDYNALNGLRLEARQKLTKIKPENLFQASQISGVTPSDISVLMLLLK